MWPGAEGPGALRPSTATMAVGGRSPAALW